MRKMRGHVFLTIISLLLTLGLGGFIAFGPNIQLTHAENNGLALTPPMGWNNYNHFGCAVGASIIEHQADAMVSSGLKAVGYQYINIDALLVNQKSRLEWKYCSRSQ